MWFGLGVLAESRPSLSDHSAFVGGGGGGGNESRHKIACIRCLNPCANPVVIQGSVFFSL